MLDWQVHEEGDSLLRSTEEGSSGHLYHWALFGGLLLLLMVLALLIFRWRISERQEAMQADLKAFIRHEEQQRLFGLTERADKLMVPEAPKVWQEAYLSSFAEPDNVQPVELEVAEIEFDGTGAYVTLRLDNVVSVRFYRLIGQRWRRAPLLRVGVVTRRRGERAILRPLAFWGEPRQIELADEGLTIAYRARDEAFVERLSHELPALLGEGSAWPKSASNIITVSPVEFGPPLLLHEKNEIVLNSPKLVMADALDGEGAVRLALADALLAKVNSNRQTPPLLPGATPFLAAIRNTFILRWALPDEAIPRQIWHDTVEGLWKSPFLGQWRINREEVLLERVWEPNLSDATFLLVADYLYDQSGTEGLQSVLKQLPTAQSWDSIFYPLTGRYTIELEEEVLSANSTTKTMVHNAPQLPFSVTLLDMDSESGLLEVELAGQDKPLSIQTADATLIGAEGAILNGHCATLHKQLTITEGDWLKVGQELQTRQLLVNESSPSISLPAETTLAPPDTFAYLAERRGGGGFGAFLALSEDGTTTHLTTLPSLMNSAEHMQPWIPWPPRILLSLSVRNCEQTWLFMYDPQQGIIDRWLTSSNERIFTSFVWHPLEGDFILTGPIPKNARHSLKKVPYWSATPEKPLRLLPEFPSGSYPLAWLGGKIVTLDEERGAIKLIELTSGEVVKRIALAGENVRFFILSEDSKHFFYGLQPAQKQIIAINPDDLLDLDAFSPTQKQTVHVVDLESGQDTLLFSASDDESLWPVGGGSSTNRLLLLSTPKRLEEPIPTRLLLLDLKASMQPTVVMEIPRGQYVTSALACEDDRVLMTIYSPGDTEVRRWQPDGSTKSLLRSDKELQLLSCR